MKKYKLSIVLALTLASFLPLYAAPPVISLTVDGVNISNGSSLNKTGNPMSLAWSTTNNPAVCSLNSSPIPTSGTNTMADTELNPGLYIIVCGDANGGNSTTFSFRLNSEPVQVAPVTVNLSSNTSFSATRNSVASTGDILSIPLRSDGSVNLTWNTQNATVCELNGKSIAFSGSSSFTNLAADGAVYRYYCFNNSTLKSASINFKVVAPNSRGSASDGNNNTTANTSNTTNSSNATNSSDTSDSDTEDTDCLDIPANVILKYRSKDTRDAPYVSLLQDFLYEKGYLTSQPTGFFGAGTLKAVKVFQRANSISGTGSVGVNTKAVIKRISCSAQSVTAQSSTNGSAATQNQGAVSASFATGVPVVTIKAKGYGRNNLGVVWTATNNPSYCTATDGTAGWAGVKEIPSTAISYNQMLYVQERPNRATYTITCTNKYGASQPASTMVDLFTELGQALDESVSYLDYERLMADSKYYPANWPSSWKSYAALSTKVPRSNTANPFQLDDWNTIDKYKSRMINFIYNADNDLKICKSFIRYTTPSVTENDRQSAFNSVVNVSSKTSFPCTEDSDFVSPTQKNFIYGNPLANRINTSNVFTKSILPPPFSWYPWTREVVLGSAEVTTPSHIARTLDGSLDNTELYKGPARMMLEDNGQFIVYKASNGGVSVGVWYRIGGATPEENSAFDSPVSAIPVTTLTATSQAPNTVTLTWSSTNDTTECVAYKNEVIGWGSTILPYNRMVGDGVIKTAPTSNGTRSQTLTVTAPGTYTFKIRCRNNYSFGQSAEATVAVR